MRSACRRSSEIPSGRQPPWRGSRSCLRNTAGSPHGARDPLARQIFVDDRLIRFGLEDACAHEQRRQRPKPVGQGPQPALRVDRSGTIVVAPTVVLRAALQIGPPGRTVDGSQKRAFEGRCDEVLTQGQALRSITRHRHDQPGGTNWWRADTSGATRRAIVWVAVRIVGPPGSAEPVIARSGSGIGSPPPSGTPRRARGASWTSKGPARNASVSLCPLAARPVNQHHAALAR